MRKTKNDLSFNKAKLDYAALLKITEIAYGRCLQEIRRLTSDLTPVMGVGKVCHLTAERLAGHAANLVTIAETLHTLREGLNRDDIEIVNKGENRESS